MAAKKLQRPKRKKRVKEANATTRSTAGPGFAFEDQIGAYLLLQMLMGESLPGSDDAIGCRLQTQTKSLRWSIDDLLATSDPGIDTQRQLAVSCKSNRQVTGAGLPKEFVLAAWEQWSSSRNGPMKRDRDSLMLATRGHHPAFEALWADTKNWSTGDPKIALARIGATAKHRKFFKSIKGPIKKVKGSVRDEDLIRFTQRLEVMATDFDLANSEDRRKAIGRCRNLLNGAKLVDGRKLWEALVASTRDARLGNGTVELANLIRGLAQQFDLKDHPNYESSWRTLEAATVSYKKNIEVTLPNKFSIDRQTDAVAVASIISQKTVSVLYGESGCGKSALVKSVLDERLPSYRQVWLGPDQLSVALNEVDRWKLNIAHPLGSVLKASSKPTNILVIDSAERLTREVQNSVHQLVAAITDGSNQNAWRVIIIGQTEAWTEGALQGIANATDPPNHEVRLISARNVKAALQSAPRLGWAASHDEIVTVLSNLRTLAWVLEAESRFRPQDAQLLASYTAIADHLWRYWTDGKVKLQNLLIRLAEREAKFEHSFAVSELDPADAATIDQRLVQTPLRLNNRNRIEFQHGLAAEWARFQRLKEISDQPEQWAAYATHPLWIGALRMLGAFLLRESVDGRSAWDIALEKIKGQQAADILLDALCLDPLAGSFLAARADLLLKDNGELLSRLLKRFQHVATAPGGVTKTLADIAITDPSLTLYIEAQFRTPIFAHWPAIALFLHTNRDRVAALISPTVCALCEKWLTTLPVEYAPGVAMPFRKEFAEVALATAHALQLEQKKEKIFIGDFGKAIYPAVLAAAPDLPDLVSAWALQMARRQPYDAELKKKIAEHREQKAREHKEKLRADPEYRARFERRASAPTFIPSSRRLPFWPLGPQGRVERQFSECVTNTNALVPLMRVRPKVAAEVLLGTIIEDSPEAKYGSSRFDDGFGLEFDMQSYPTAYWKSPFFSFLQVDATTALETLITLINFCTERWAAEYSKLWSGPTPEIVLHLPSGVERKFIGGSMVFLWSQTNSTHTGQLHSALAALERFLVMKIEGGSDVAPDIQRVLVTGTSVALLGVLTNVGKCSPELFRGILRPLVTHNRMYNWDDERLKALPFAFAVQWAQQGDMIFNMARDWHNAPYRNKTLREVIRELVRGDPEFASFVNESTAQWPRPDDQKRALELRILAAELDNANYRTGSDGTDEFVYPGELARDIQAFQAAKASTLQILQLPEACRQFLRGGSSLNDASAQALATMFDTINAEDGLEEEFKERSRVAAAATLLVRGADWLVAHGPAGERAWTILHTTLAGISDTVDELRASRLERAGTLEFAAHAAFAWWMNTGAGDAQASVLRIVTSGDDTAVTTIFNLAYTHRSELGDRWWRLLYLGLLWSALSVLMPRYGHGEGEAVRWARWLNWFRTRCLNDTEATLAQIDFVDIAKRLERLERVQWRREFEREDWSRGPPPDERRSAGLHWNFLEAAFAWLLWDASEPNPAWNDEAEFKNQRQIILSLWEFEVWLNHRPREERDDDPVPNQLAYKVVATIAKMATKASAEVGQQLWEPVLKLGAPAHYSVAHFLSCWFFEASRIDASDFAMRWRPMIDYALNAPEWGGGKPWYYGQRLLRQVLGYRSESILDRNAAFQIIVQQMRDYYARWAGEHLNREDDNVVALCVFLASPTGRSLRINGLGWLHQAVTADSWYRPEMGNALVEFLNVALTEDAPQIRANVPARDAFLSLVALLVEKQVSAALALQERARRAF